MSYVVKSRLNCNGKLYEQGDEFDGPSELVEGLLKDGVLEKGNGRKNDSEPAIPRQGYTAKEEEVVDEPVKPESKSLFGGKKNSKKGK